MDTVLVTGSCGLIGSEACRYYAAKGFQVIGIDNDMRGTFFGEEASVRTVRYDLIGELPTYKHQWVDIRNKIEIDNVFREFGRDIKLVIHTAAQPSHDWAARDPLTDFGVNAFGTINILESTRLYSPDAVFIFTSTNKVYGDNPNKIPLLEYQTRLDPSMFSHYRPAGISEMMSLDHTTHSVFGASKVAADIMTQEYGRYFGMKTGTFRCGCLTGPGHKGAKLHGFLAYLVKCVVEGTNYQVIGYGGKQVRDNIHSYDVVTAFDEFFKKPEPGAVYNLGGGYERSCSVLEAIGMAEELAGKRLLHSFVNENRIGDHKWYVSDLSKFRNTYPNWRMKYSLKDIMQSLIDTASK